MNVADYLLAAADDADVALVDGGQTHSHGDLRRAAVGLAQRIEHLTARGDRVGILARNSFFWAAAYLAALYAGRVVVPFPTTALPDEVGRQARFVGLSCVLADRVQLRRQGAELAHLAVIDDTVLGDGPDGRVEWAPAEVDGDADALLQLTSGTTSAPKAVRVSHRNIEANTSSIVRYLELRRDDRMLVVLPFSYCFGLSLLNTHLRVGGSVALCHTMTFPETVVSAIDEHRCTGFAGVPSTYQILLKASSLATRRLDSLRHLQQAGGRLAAPLVDALVAAQPHAKVFVMYGQSEATARLSYLPPEEIARRRGSIGRGIPGLTLRVVDRHGHDVTPGETGEVVAEGPSITKGYWNDPEATAERFDGSTLRTGDLATVDEDGFIYIVDRLSDFIKSWGFRVSSQEIEEAALRSPQIAAAAAVGVPDDDAGEAIVLFVVPNEAGMTEDDVLAPLRVSLAKHMVPHRVEFVTSMPLNDNGKVVKSRLRELAVSGC